MKWGLLDVQGLANRTASGTECAEVAFWYPGKWVYVAKDDRHTYKIGCTTRTVGNQIQELQRKYKFRFSAVAFARAHNERNLERLIVETLDDYRQGDTEWFELATREARGKLLRVMQEFSKAFRVSPFFTMQLDRGDASRQNSV